MVNPLNVTKSFSFFAFRQIGATGFEPVTSCTPREPGGVLMKS